ncbi:MAG: SAM-dependent methyltransferase [Candidatus Acidiferrales bacterium]
MAVTLDKAVPWGRSLDEYVRMFDLTAADLDSRILDCAGGPSSFNAEMYRSGRTVVSCDPIYQFSPADIARRIEETRDTILEMTHETRERFVWREFESVERLGQIRMVAMRQFLDDLPVGISQGRYRVAELPALPFRDREFDLAVCSHFLFTYSDLFPLDFHINSIRELCRVAREARIFPLLPGFSSGHSPHLAPVARELTKHGYRCELRRVPYEFQKGGNEMLRVSRSERPASS